MKELNKIFFSEKEWTNIFQSLLVVFAVGSLGIVFSLIFGLSAFLGIGLGGALFFLFLFFKDPFLFLLCIIPFRMMLDYFGELFAVQVSGDMFLSISQAMGLLVFAIGVSYFVFFVRSKEVFREFIPFWIFFAWGCASLTFSLAPYETARDLLRIFDILALASMAFALTKTSRDLKRVLVAILVSSFVPFLFGMWQWITGNTFTKDLFVDLSRVYGTFGHPNVFGLYLFSIIVLSFLFYRVFAENSKERIFAFFVGASSLVLIFPTLSRVSWVILLLFFLIVAGVRFRKMFFPIILLAFFVFAMIPSLQERVVDIFEMSADSSVLWRINIWKDGINQVFVENRFLFGFGLDTFPTVITNLHTQEFGSPDTHNDFVKFFVEGGIVGLLIYIFWMGWFFVRLFLMFLVSRKERRNEEMYFIILIFFLCIGIASLSDAVFKSTPLQWVLWITIGSLLGLEARKKK